MSIDVFKCRSGFCPKVTPSFRNIKFNSRKTCIVFGWHKQVRITASSPSCLYMLGFTLVILRICHDLNKTMWHRHREEKNRNRHEADDFPPDRKKNHSPNTILGLFWPIARQLFLHLSRLWERKGRKIRLVGWMQLILFGIKTPFLSFLDSVFSIVSLPTSHCFFLFTS